jgi:general secretion pathway protein F
MSSSGSEPQRVTLEDLAALNREIAALVRCGLPLEAGLRQVADEFNGPTSRLAARLAEETAAGKTLAEAIATQGDTLPAVYHAVIEAGASSGRLAAALEGFAETAARMAALHRIARQAILYPLMVTVIAWWLLLLAASAPLPAYDQVELGEHFWIASWRPATKVLWFLAAVVPLTLVVLMIIWWRRSSTLGIGRGWLSWTPGARRAALLCGQANFADLLHTMLTSRVPLPEALPLAASASGLSELQTPVAQLAAQISAGHSLKSQLLPMRRLPPLVRTALLIGPAEDNMLAGLRRASDSYRERAAAWIVDVAILAPVTITVGLGLGVVGVYALLILQPYFMLLHELSAWNWR